MVTKTILAQKNMKDKYFSLKKKKTQYPITGRVLFPYRFSLKLPHYSLKAIHNAAIDQKIWENSHSFKSSHTSRCTRVCVCPGKILLAKSTCYDKYNQSMT